MTKFTQIHQSKVIPWLYDIVGLMENGTGMFSIKLFGSRKYLPVIYSFAVEFNSEIPDLAPAIRDLVFNHTIPDEINQV